MKPQGKNNGGAVVWPPFFAWNVALRLLLSAISIAGIADQAQADRARIAVALPLSGLHQALGHEIKIAIELALDEAQTHANGDAAATVTFVDDECSSAGGAAAARAIVAAPPGTRADTVVGHACPSAAQAAGPIYEKAGIVSIIAGSLPARAPQTRQFGSRHYRLPADGLQGAVIGARLAAAGAAARVAIVRDRTLFAQTAMAPVLAALAAEGRMPLLVETYAGGEKDFSGLAQRLKAAGVTHLVLASFPSEAALLVPEVRRVNPDISIVATDQLAAPEFGRLAGPAADELEVALVPDASAYPRARRVAEMLVAKGGASSRASLASYAAIQVVLSAIDPTASDGDSLAAALPAKTFETILGPVRFDANGAANIPSHVFYRWSGGTLIPPVAGN